MKGDAIPCNQPPLLEAKPANQNRRKSRIRNAEIASDNFGRDRFWDNSLICFDLLPLMKPVVVCVSKFTLLNFPHGIPRKLFNDNEFTWNFKIRNLILQSFFDFLF